MRCKTDEEVPEQVIRPLCVVEPFQAVELLEKVIEESSNTQEVLSTQLRGDDVLRPELHQLIRTFKRMSARVSCVTQFAGPVHAQTYLRRFEVSQRQVRHVEPRRAVLEHEHTVLAAKNPLLKGLRCLALRYHPPDAFHVQSLAFAQPSDGLFVDMCNGNPLRSDHLCRLRSPAAPGALRKNPLGPALLAYPDSNLDGNVSRGDCGLEESLRPAKATDGK